LALFAWLAATAWLRPLAIPDEGRYVGVAWEMVGSGNWLVPMLDTLPYFHKPPLFYWMTAAALSVFGANEWAARLASLIAATACGFGLYLFLRRWTRERTARIALVVLATMPFFFGGAQFANMDMLVAACMTGTILCTADAVLSSPDGSPRRATLAGAYALAALGVLAKGLIGVVIPGLVIVAWLLLMHRFKAILQLLWLPGVVLFALIAVPWFALMEARYPGFFDYFFVHHHLQRYATSGFNGRQAFWFYVPVFAAITLPWSPLLVAGLRKQSPTDGLRPEILSLMWIWLAATLLFFSLPASKLVGYVLPAAPPAAALIAHSLIRLAGDAAGALRRSLRIAAGAAALCLAVLVGVSIHSRNDISSLITQIRPRMAPGDHIIAVRAYPFSAPFYLQRHVPMRVFDIWNAPWMKLRDDWRRELHEAGKFDAERARGLLLSLDDLVAALCSDRTVWVIGPEQKKLPSRELTLLDLVAHNRHGTIWRSPPDRCPFPNRDAVSPD
jgi:4-amino-4-deoxy-L-arabinose transferase-like glycosyltransferase